MYIPPWAFYKMKEWDDMNVFYLDRDPRVAAKLHCDKHVVKMILETAQVLSAVHHRFKSPAPYKETHKNHPSTLWAGASDGNYYWLQRLGIELCSEYTRRYGKVHKTEAYITGDLRCAPAGITVGKFEEPPQCMPEECKVPGDPVEAYKNYYRMHKAYMAKWKNTEVPAFMQSVTDEI
jgi:hypothetical protein